MAIHEDVLRSNTQVEIALTEEEMKPKKICSVFPNDLAIPHVTGNYTVPGKGSERYGFCMVNSSGETRDYALSNFVKVINISATDTALDIIGLSRARKLRSGQQITERANSPWFERGLFVPEGDEPTEAELKAAEKRLEAWCREKLTEADNTWQLSKNPRHIDSNAKIAAGILRVKREWAEGLEETPQKMRCPACREEIMYGALRCKECAAVISYDKDHKPFWRDNTNEGLPPGISTNIPSPKSARV